MGGEGDCVMAVRRIPNERLRALLGAAGWSGERLARTVNALGAEAGLPLQYRRASVGQWLAGMRPAPAVAALVAEAFTRELGRPVDVAETGLEPPGAQPPTEAPPADSLWETDPATRLAELSGDGPRRRRGTGAASADGVYSLAALRVPDWVEAGRALNGRGPWSGSGAATAGATGRTGRTGGTSAGGRIGRSVRAAGGAGGTGAGGLGGPRVDREQVAAAGAMVRVFSDADAAFGGGHSRAALAGYLRTVIAPALRAQASPAVRRELLAVASRLTYLCGFMCFDDELHGAAEHYYLAGLRLAAEAGDCTGYAVTLRALSVQAGALGHPLPALYLAEAAVHTVTTAGSGPEAVDAAEGSARTRAFLFGQLAVAEATVGDRQAAVAHLSTAQAHLERADGESGSVGAYHSASLAHQHAAVAAAAGEHGRAIAALQASLRHRPADERRSRAVTLARLAELQLAAGHLEAACASWQAFCDEYPRLRSARIERALDVLRSRTAAHRGNSAARALHARATALRAQRRAGAAD